MQQVQLNAKFCRKEYNSSYDIDLTVSEVIRNICVNLRIDPDTKNGITENVLVRCSKTQEHIVYTSNQSLLSLLNLYFKDTGIVEIDIELL